MVIQMVTQQKRSRLVVLHRLLATHVLCLRGMVMEITRLFCQRQKLRRQNKANPLMSIHLVVDCVIKSHARSTKNPIKSSTNRYDGIKALTLDFTLGIKHLSKKYSNGRSFFILFGK